MEGFEPGRDSRTFHEEAPWTQPSSRGFSVGANTLSGALIYAGVMIVLGVVYAHLIPGVHVNTPEVNQAVLYPRITWTSCSPPSSSKGTNPCSGSRSPSSVSRDTPWHTPLGFSTVIL